MKLTLKNIKSIKSKAISPLKKRVCNYLINKWSDYNDKKHIFTDVLNYGCQSGVVGFLIYYSDTTAFYKKYQSEINELLYEYMEQTGIYSPKELLVANGKLKTHLLLKITTKTYLLGLALKKPCVISDLSSNLYKIIFMEKYYEYIKRIKN